MNRNFDQLPPTGDKDASRQRFRYCANLHLLKHAVPKEAGGHGDSYQKLVQAHYQLGLHCQDPGLILSLNAHLWGAVFPILHYGTNRQKASLLPKLLSGEIIAGHAITEPQAGSDLNALTTTAQPTDQGFILQGHKRFITNTPIADVMIVYILLDNQLSAFLIEKDDTGVQFTDTPCVSGCKTATMGDVIMENCTIDTCRQLGKTGAGKMMIQHALELERAFIFAGIAGIMEWQLNTVISYSRKRKVNGRHLGYNQAISHKIADMKLRLDTLRLWVNECAHLKDNRQRISMASAQAKLYASEAFLQSSLDAVHILGSGGLVETAPMAGLINDAMASRLFSGSSEIQKNIIAGLLGTAEGFRG
jgi:L-prolyl-PCP dehydrogenase